MPRRSPVPAAAIAIAALAVTSLSGCFALPPAVTAPTAEPDPSTTATAAPDPDPTSAAPTPTEDEGSSELPAMLPVGTALPAGSLPGWETSIITAEGWEPLEDSDFPAGPTIAVVEAETDCYLWAYQGAQDGEGTDERELSIAGIEAASEMDVEGLELSTLELGPSASQGMTVEMVSLEGSTDDGWNVLYASRNFQASQTTSSLYVECPAELDANRPAEIATEHLAFNILLE